MALVPFVIFITITILLSFYNAADLNMMIGAGVLSLLVGMFFAKDIGHYWDVVLEGLGSKVGMTAVLLWMIVGIYGNILKSGSIVEGLVWLSVKLSVKGSAFTVAAFIFSAIFAVATGSGFGTITTMSFILYPAGILLGSHPGVLAGAIISGGAFGDNLAPVSDTTIIAATSQEYNNKEGSADIGATVKMRLPYVLVAGSISIILFYIFGGAGGGSDAALAGELLAQYQNPKGLLLLIPTFLVIFMAVRGVDIFAALATGVFTALAIGFAGGLFGLSALISIDNGVVTGAIPEGVASMTTVSILLIMVVSMGNILIKSGIMDVTVDWLNDRIIKTPRGAELTIFALATVFGVLIAAINTIANICVAPFINGIGKKNSIHPNRRANILATTMCSFPFLLPYGGSVLLFLTGVTTMQSAYPFLPSLAASDMFFSVFYCWTIWFVMLIACSFGIGRMFEGEDGEMVTEPILSPGLEPGFDRVSN